MLKVTLALASAAAVLAATPALAQSGANLDVAGTVPGYCNVTIRNGSSGTTNIALDRNQDMANLEILCNNANGTRLTVTGKNADLLSSRGNRINYTFRVTSTDEPLFSIPDTDFSTENESKSSEKAPFSRRVANGARALFSLDINKDNESTQVDSSGRPMFPASRAPADTYSENFKFSVSSI